MILEHYDTVGDEFSLPHYPAGWANAGNTPFQWYKQFTYEGGIKDPMIIRYPKLIKDPGAVRNQYQHVTDITPTILDILGFDKPEIIKGVPQKPIEGISFKESLENKEAKGKYIQHYEMHGNRSIYKDGWKAVVNHGFNASFGESYEDDEWELYHVDEDYSEKYNVAARYPEKLKELQEDWFIQAGKYNVFPMQKNGFLAFKKQLKEAHKIPLPEVNLSYKHVRYPFVLPADPGIATRTGVITVKLARKSKQEEGVLIAAGDRFSGISFYVKNNRLKYVFNLYGRTYFVAESADELPTGEVEVKLAFTVTGEEKAIAEIFINEQKTGGTKVDGFPYSRGPGGVTCLKANPFTSVYDKDYAAPFEYTGEIKQIDIHLDAAGLLVEKALKQAFVED